MSKEIIADFCVIGAGAAGLSFAAGAAQMGANVVLIEKSKMGGDCLHYGCIPSKSLIHVARIAKNIKLSENFGWKISKKYPNYSTIDKYLQDVIKSIQPKDSKERFESLGVKVIKEKGQFLDSKIFTTKNYKIKAKYYIIATGSKAIIPNIPGLSKVKYYTNHNIFNLKTLPKTLAIIGGGAIGLEMAQAFASLGSKVVILSHSVILKNEDQELVSILRKQLLEEKIELYENVKINEITGSSNNKIIINFKTKAGNKNLEFSDLLLATGRMPNIMSLNLDAANLDYNNKGILVSDNLETSEKNIYAIGDCIGNHQFTHVAGHHASLSLTNSIFGFRYNFKRATIPHVIFTAPEIAAVGLDEDHLKRNNISYKILKINYSDLDRAITDHHIKGLIKVMVSNKGKILGASVIGHNAGELIYTWTMAIENNLKIYQIAKTIAPYLTYSEINKQLASQYYAPKIFSPLMKKIVKFMLRWR